MNNYPHSIVTVCPAAVRDALLAAGEAMGVSGGMNVLLSDDGTGPPTHYGSHAWAGSEFVAIMTGQVVPEIEGMDAQDIASLLAAVTVSVDPIVDGVALTKQDHFNHVINGLGLQIIEA